MLFAMFSPFESPMLPLNMVQSSLNHVLLSTQIHEHSQIISHPHVSPQKKTSIHLKMSEKWSKILPLEMIVPNSQPQFPGSKILILNSCHPSPFPLFASEAPKVASWIVRPEVDWRHCGLRQG
jgi:hypothetical protein